MTDGTARAAPATMSDVARLAGVSTATVSHVLNGTRAVRETTRRAVLAAAATLDYTPHVVARSLAGGSTMTLGLVLSAISNPYFGELLSAAERSAAAAGYTLRLVDPHEDPDYELTVVDRLHRHRVDGVVIAPSARPEAALERLDRRGVPTGLLARLIDPGRDQVGVENREATARLVEHLADLGHTDIALVTGLPGLSTTEERIVGYREGLQRCGLAVDPHLQVSGDSDSEPARRAVLELLDAPRPPSALVVGNNSMTIGALQALRSRGRSVPSDIALVAFDDFPWSELLAPPLTTIAQPFGAIATEAVRLLLRRMAEPDGPPTTVRMHPTFAHRASCGCPYPAEPLPR